jgi:hypothetical protein
MKNKPQKKTAAAPRPLPELLALASVVTYPLIHEYQLLRFAAELFHGPGFEWFIRCDQQSAAVLGKLPQTHCTVFTAEQRTSKVAIEAEAFRPIVAEKMGAMEDAWRARSWKAVVFLDADLLPLREVFSTLMKLPGDVLITPHYFQTSDPQQAANLKEYGYYNSGLVFARNRLFPAWWREAMVSQPHRFSDQHCLNEVGEYFTVHSLGRNFNVGHWSQGALLSDTLVLHLHMFTGLATNRSMVLDFLHGYGSMLQKKLIGEIERLAAIYLNEFGSQPNNVILPAAC